MEEAIRKAHVLIEALPYIKEFHNKTIVIKYGGSILADEKIRDGVLEDIVFLSFMGLRPVLVHGAGAHISERMRTQGKRAHFVNGLRVTDEETILLVEEELQKLNDLLVERICSMGARAVGLSYKKDKQLIQAEKKEAEIDLGLVGKIIRINTKPINECLQKNMVVVVLPLGRGPDRKTYNINADEAASSISAALKAEKLVILTNVRGIMRHPDEPHSFLSSLTVQEAKGLIKNNIIQTGMIPKVTACFEALNSGVRKTHIIDARLPHALLLEIFTDKGVGTEIVK